MYRNKKTGALVSAMAFHRETLSALVIFAGGRLDNITCASDQHYHKFHATLPGNMRIVEGDVVLRAEDGEVMSIRKENFEKEYEEQ